MGEKEGQPVTLSHLLFADDTLICCGAESSQLEYLQMVLICFEVVSGLKINLSKSELVPAERVDNVHSLAAVLGCKVTSLPIKYLSMPLEATFKSKAIWSSVVERLEGRLASWKKLYLSKGGWIVLIKSSLSSLPTYLLFLFPIPVSVAHIGLRSCREIFYGEVWGRRLRCILSSGGKCALQSRMGGWDLGSCVASTKLCWGSGCGGIVDSLWRTIIDVKYGVGESGWNSGLPTGTLEVSVWRHIRKGWEEFVPNTRLVVGNGPKVRFWHDRWCGDTPLKVLFPSLFQLARDKAAKVSNYMDDQGGQVSWSLVFVRAFQDWEMHEFNDFLTMTDYRGI